MIQSYRDKRTKHFALGGDVREFTFFARQISKRLETLDAAEKLHELAQLKSNQLEKLKGDRKD